jgi:two-component system cell cycle sensor histidine kinase/response regulator CckA
VQPRPEPPAASPGWHGRGTVLVVDDEPGVRQIARLILEKSGFRVVTAADGEEAVRVFRDHAGEITAIVLDMTMPVMSGEDTYAELRSIGAGAPVILCSGYTEQEVAGRLAGQSLNGFLQKPYEPADLIGALQKVLEQKVMHQKL